jgi:hypothetical protein
MVTPANILQDLQAESMLFDEKEPELHKFPADQKLKIPLKQ